MLAIGKTYELTITSESPEGYCCNYEDDRILIPAGPVPLPLEIGQKIELFVYTYKEPYYLGSLQKPKALLGQFAVLEVAAKTEHGAFLDWGLEKDLFLPFKEQNAPIMVGDKIPICVLQDHIFNRLLATMKVSRHLKEATTQYEAGQKVEAVIYKFGPLGAFCFVDQIFQGLIYQSEIFEDLSLGQQVMTYVKQVREDGKLDLSLRQTGKVQNDNDQLVLLEALQNSQGFLPYHDKTDPEVIRDRLSMSKKAFKRAVGALYKTKKIRIEPEGIRLI
jgi:predicted RNA-binding protein (virulence factor B family)